MKRFGILLFVLSLAPSAVLVGAVTSAPAQGESVEVRPVPEPATLLLIGAAAGVAGARKLWQNRRRARR